MAIRSVKDVVDAHEAGRVHTQRFFKNAGGTFANVWQDWSFASGQPAYDARIGNALAFNAFVASRNDAIYFPPMPAGMERRLEYVDFATVAGGTGQSTVEFQLYDLIGVYPLIDGDNIDLQEMDNTVTLPRYTDGAGVFPVLVNHIAPALSQANMTVNYTNSAGVAKSVVWRTTLAGQNNVAYTTSGSGTNGPLYCALDGGDNGVRSIDNIQFDVAPGGLWAVYLVKPLVSMADRTGTTAAVTQKGPCEKAFMLTNAWHMPEVKDGAWLGFFYMTAGTARSVAMHGNLTFVWG